MASSGKYMKVLSQMLAHCADSTTFMKCAGKCRPILASEGNVRVEFEVTEDQTNSLGTLHGGFTASLVDMLTTSACLMTPKGQPGVSVGLNVNYLAAAKIGDTVIVDARVTRMGNTLAYTEAELYRKSDNKMIAKGLHTKAFPAVANK